MRRHSQPRPQLPARGRRHRGHPGHALWAAVFGLVAGACSETPSDGGGGVTSGELVLTVAEPGDKVLSGGVVQVTGDLKAKGGVKSPALVATSKGVELGKGGAGGFAFAWDTTAKDDKGQPRYKDGNQCVTLAASAASGETASMNRCVIIDNTPPETKLIEPLPGAVAIGKFRVVGSFNDKNIGLATVLVDGTKVVDWCDKKAPAGDPMNCDVCAARPGIRKCMSGSGGFDFELDFAGQPTKTVSVRAIAVDLRNQQTEASADVLVLKAPKYETYRHDRMTDIAGPKAIKTADIDGDGIADALIAADSGLYFARGDGAEGKGDGSFAAPTLAVPGSFALLAQLEIDGDGRFDHVAVGTIENQVKAVALLSRSTGPLPLHTVVLDTAALAIAAGDLDNDGVADIAIGGAADAAAVTILKLYTAPICPTKANPQRACKDAQDPKDLAVAEIFRPALKLSVTGDVAAIAIGNFHADGTSKDYNDIALGRGATSLVSVCRNSKDGFDACLDVQSSLWTSDMSDVKGLLTADWNQDGFDDLIVGSAGASILRWVQGNGDGTFTFDPATDRVFLTTFSKLAIEQLVPPSLGSTGPFDVATASVAIVSQAREVLLIPLDPANDTHGATCFRGFVVGGGIIDIDPIDTDADGMVDMVALDAAPIGISVAFGRGDGTYEAGEVLKVCGYPDSAFVFTNVEVGRFVFEDLTADKKPDLFIGSIPGRSRLEICPALPGGTAQPLPALHYALYVNGGQRLNAFGRAAEFSPFYNKHKYAGGVGQQEPPREGCGDKIPAMTALRTGAFSAKSVGRDLVVAVDQDYVVGGEPVGPAEMSLDVPNTGCVHREYYEISNFFGDKKKEPEQGKPPPGPSQTCKNFGPTDKEFKKPLTGFGQGAPWGRASALLFLSGDPTKPYGIGSETNPRNPWGLTPFYAQAAGRRPIDLVVGKFDDDPYDDFATVMKSVGGDTQLNFLDARVRYFRGDGAGKVRAVLLANGESKEAQQIANDFNIDTAAVEIVAVPEADKDRWALIEPTSKLIVDYVTTTYRILNHNPLMAAAAGFCASTISSLYTATEAGNFSVIRSLGAMKFAKAQSPTSQTGLKHIATGQMNGDTCTDVLFGGGEGFGFVAGTPTGFAPNADAQINTAGLEVVAIGNADVNQDKILDLIVVDAKSSQIELFLGDGKGKFHRHEVGLAISPTGGRLQQADVDGDGCNELAVAGTYGVTVLRNLGCVVP